MTSLRFRPHLLASRPPLKVPAHATRAAAAGAAAVAVVGILTLIGEQKLGAAGLLAPLALAGIVVLLQRPMLAVGTVLVLVILAEDKTSGLRFTHYLYGQALKGVSPLDLLVAVAFVSVALDLMRRKRSPRLHPVLALPLALVALAIVCGILVGRSNGQNLRHLLAASDLLGYLVVIPFMIYNLDLDERRLSLLLQVGLGLAVLKAVIGLVLLAMGISYVDLESAAPTARATGGTHITYFEPTANWLDMMGLLGIAAAWLGGRRVPRWVLLSMPLLLASVLFSYRRNFWIATVLALLLLLIVERTPRKRVTLVTVTVLIAASIWALNAVSFQSQLPVVRRLQSLSLTKVQTNVQDRYRLDERANVIAEIKRNPVAGLGIDVPWSASAAPLGVEHDAGRNYVHFGFLWWWLKLGILGAIAYVGLLISGALLAWRGFRRHTNTVLRYLALASLCAIVGLAVLETTVSFIGSDARFTVVFSAQLGLLAVLARPRVEPAPLW